MKKILAVTISALLVGCGGGSGDSGDGGGTNPSKPMVLLGDTTGAVAFGIVNNQSTSEVMNLNSFLESASTSGYCDRLVKVVYVEVENPDNPNEGLLDVPEEPTELETVKVFENLNDGYSCVIDKMAATKTEIILSGSFLNLADQDGEPIAKCNMIRMPLRTRDSQAECLIAEKDDFTIHAVNQISVSANGDYFGVTYFGTNELESAPDYKYKTASAIYEKGIGLGSDNFAFYTSSYDQASRKNDAIVANNGGQYVFNHNHYEYTEYVAEYYPFSGSNAQDFSSLVSATVPIKIQGVENFDAFRKVQLGNYLLTHPFERRANCSNLTCVDNSRIFNLENGPQSIVSFDLIDPEWNVPLAQIHGDITVYDSEFGHIIFGAPDLRTVDRYAEPKLTAYSINTDDYTLQKVYDFNVPFITQTVMDDQPVSIVQHGDTIVYAVTKQYEKQDGLVGYNLTQRKPLQEGEDLLKDFADWHGRKISMTANGFKIFGQHLGQTKTMYYNQKTDTFDTTTPDGTEIGNSIPLMPSIPN